jgi:hypothetical protein
MRVLAVMAVIIGLLATSGCIDETTTIVLNKDGSGTIYKTTYMSAAAMGMMGGMTAGFAGMSPDGDTAPRKPANPLMDEDGAKKDAADYGPGVTFASIQEVKKNDGSMGATVIYKFQDISKLTLNMGSDNEMGGSAGDMGGEQEPEPQKEEKNPVTFAYTAGNLTINMPEPGKDKEVKQEVEPKTTGEVAPTPEGDNGGPGGDPMMAGMMQMFKGMRIRQLIQLPSEIKETNASFVSTDSKTMKKQFITLFDISIDKVLAQPDGQKKMEKLQEEKDTAKQMEMLKGIEGIKIELARKVTVKF